MAKLILSMFMSLDGYIEGPDGFAGPAWSDDLATHWSGYAMENAGHFVYGRTNFEFNKGFWTDMSGPAAHIPYAAQMNETPKTVISTTLPDNPGWNGTVVRGELEAAMTRLKREAERDIFCFGGAQVADSLIALDAFDEYRMMVTPGLFGGGKRLFAPGFPKIDLNLLKTAPLDTGAVILHYARAR